MALFLHRVFTDCFQFSLLLQTLKQNCQLRFQTFFLHRCFIVCFQFLTLFRCSNSSEICDFKPPRESHDFGHSSIKPCFMLPELLPGAIRGVGAKYFFSFSTFGQSLPSKSQADLCKEMLRRCFAKRVQSGGACLVLLTKPCAKLTVPDKDLC